MLGHDQVLRPGIVRNGGFATEHPEWWSYGDPGSDTGIADVECHHRSEGVTRHEDGSVFGERRNRFECAERIQLLGDPAVVRALALVHAAKIESDCRESSLVARLDDRSDDWVEPVSAVEGMGMAHHRSSSALLGYGEVGMEREAVCGVECERVEAHGGTVPSCAMSGPTVPGPTGNGDQKLPIKMLSDRILVRIPDKEGERRSSGGILIPATAQISKRLAWAEVVAIGQNVRSAEVGDRVLFSPEDRYEVEVGGADYIMLRERDIHAVAASRIEASTGLYI